MGRGIAPSRCLLPVLLLLAGGCGPAAERAPQAVSDHGEGIAPGFRPTAFQAFSRGDQSRSQSGAGLGLAMVGRLVQRAGGRITFVDPETEATHGIRLHLPLNK